MDTQEVIEFLLQRGLWTASRSSGPGGQRRDKVETRAELTIDSDCLVGLDEDMAARLTERLGLHERPLRLTSQAERSLARNQESVAARFAEMVTDALAPPPATRRPTRPGRGQREARLTAKGVRSKVKHLRNRPSDED